MQRRPPSRYSVYVTDYCVSARAERIREVIDRLVAEGVAVAASNGEEHTLFPVAISAAEGASLREWVRREKAAQTIEIGLGYGISSLHICEALVENGDARARHFVIDPYQSTRFAGCALQFLADAGVRPIVEYHDAPSEMVLPRFLSERRRFDLAFVDGNHRFDAVFVDLFYLGRLVRPGGIIFLDDYQLPGVNRAVAFWMRNLGWTLEEESAADRLHTWAVLRTSVTPDTRPFDFYIAF